MKRCATCRQEKPADDFHRHARRRDGRQTVCKECKRAYNATYYAERGATHRIARERHRDAMRADVDRLIQRAKQQPCVDCGANLPACAMDLDHVRGTKVADATGMRRMGRRAVEAEIAKCEVVCVNCHRSRTRRRRLRRRRLVRSGWVPGESNPEPFG